VLDACGRLAGQLTGVRVRVDDREDLRPGFKFNHWELRGVPVRVEVGPRDLDAGRFTAVPRLTGLKEEVAEAALAARVTDLLTEAQQGLLDAARQFRDSHTFRPKALDEMVTLLDDPGGFMVAGWCGSEDCEAKVKAETGATIRFLPLDPQPVEGSCIVCGQPASEEATWAQAY
jgi:prolyl-tRNA synthetase